MKYFLVPILFCFLPFFSSAQIAKPIFFSSSEKEAVKKNIYSERFIKVTFGVRVGTNLTNMNFNKGYPKPVIPVNSSWQPGFIGGVFLEVPVIQQLYFRQEYIYSLRRGRTFNPKTEYKFNYLSLPVLFKYKFQHHFSLLAGPQFGLLIKAKEKKGMISRDLTREMEDRSVGLTAAVEWQITHSVCLNIRVLHGINHVGIQKEGKGVEFKYEIAQLSAEYMFK